MSGPNPNAWNNWYHGVGSTYGTWLRGDRRGFRTFRHRAHVDGDYRNPPPPGVFEPVFEESKRNLRYPPVALSTEQRRVACEAMIDKLTRDAVEVIALAVMSNHWHLLARYPQLTDEQRRRASKSIIHDGRDPAPRYFTGRARAHASFELREQSLKPASPVWAKRPKFDPVRDRKHQLNIARYIRNHRHQGGWVYHLRKGFLAPLS
ncbi:MAG: hypothetical protein GC159_07350 [Phycisphaera sp.]|nr:hypothetical protein [Phycisphaera sp.]